MDSVPYVCVSVVRCLQVGGARKEEKEKEKEESVRYDSAI